ncbi:MAG: transporter [Burkholderiales bacterium]
MMMVAVTSRVAVVRMKPEDSNVAVRVAVNAQGHAPARLDRHDEHQKNREQATHGCDSTRLRLGAKWRKIDARFAGTRVQMPFAPVGCSSIERNDGAPMAGSRLRGARLAGILLCTASLDLVCAAENGIVTDRPDVVESSEVVGKGRFQIETSIAYERDKRSDWKLRTYATPTLFRLGVTETVELRIETGGRVRQKSDTLGVSDTTHGWADTAFGFKWHMQDRDEGAGKPGIGLLIHADVDSGGRRLRGQGVRPSARIVFEWDLPNQWSLGVMPGVIRDKDDTGKPFPAGIFAVVLGRELNERLRAFAELAATQIARQRYGGSIATFNVGAAYLTSKYTQVDLATSFGLNSDAPDFAAAVGFSIKF